MKNTWFSSDAHLDHRNIIKYCSRPFDSVEEMNEKLIQNWNEVVQDNDDVIYLGDFGLRGPEHLMPYRNRLKGNWRMFIAGNHDRTSLISTPGLADHVVKYGEKKVVSFDIDGIKLWLSHCPACVFANDPINLYGHTHEKYPLRETGNIIQRINIGVDAWNYYPVSWEQIKELITTSD